MDLEKVDSSQHLWYAAAASSGLQIQMQNAGNSGANQSNEPQVNYINDKILYKEVLKQIKKGNAVHDIPLRFVTSSGSVVHLILDCDAILQPNPLSLEDRYYRCFTRDDTARRIQEMRSNVLFQETNRSLQMLDNFMNRSMVSFGTEMYMLLSHEHSSHYIISYLTFKHFFLTDPNEIASGFDGKSL